LRQGLEHLKILVEGMLEKEKQNLERYVKAERDMKWK